MIIQEQCTLEELILDSSFKHKKYSQNYLLF